MNGFVGLGLSYKLGLGLLMVFLWVSGGESRAASQDGPKDSDPMTDFRILGQIGKYRLVEYLVEGGQRTTQQIWSVVVLLHQKDHQDNLVHSVVDQLSGEDDDAELLMVEALKEPAFTKVSVLDVLPRTLEEDSRFQDALQNVVVILRKNDQLVLVDDELQVSWPDPRTCGETLGDSDGRLEGRI